MSDELGIPVADQSPAMVAEAPAPQKNKTGLFIALGALAVLVLIGAVAAFLVFSVFSAVDEIEIREPVGGTPEASAPVTETAGASEPAARVANDEVFTFRDIFAPLAGETTTTTVTPTEDTSSTVDPSEYAMGTLYLISIGSDGGVPYAVMVWNQQTITLNEGDDIAGTPWQVLDIRTTDVVMLYGDQQVVLSIGQGISK